MTRKDYIAFAERFQQEKPDDIFAFTTWRRMVWAAADIFAADNPRFDRSRFLQAAGLLD